MRCEWCDAETDRPYYCSDRCEHLALAEPPCDPEREDQTRRGAEEGHRLFDEVVEAKDRIEAIGAKLARPAPKTRNPRTFAAAQYARAMLRQERQALEDFVHNTWSRI